MHTAGQSLSCCKAHHGSLRCQQSWEGCFGCREDDAGRDRDELQNLQLATLAKEPSLMDLLLCPILQGSGHAQNSARLCAQGGCHGCRDTDGGGGEGDAAGPAAGSACRRGPAGEPAVALGCPGPPGLARASGVLGKTFSCFHLQGPPIVAYRLRRALQKCTFVPCCKVHSSFSGSTEPSGCATSMSHMQFSNHPLSLPHLLAPSCWLKHHGHAMVLARAVRRQMFGKGPGL